MATKSANVVARVEQDVKEQAEEIMGQLGIPVSVVINMLYKQIIMTHSIPFSLSIPTKLPTRDDMSQEVFDAVMLRGVKEAREDHARPVEAVMEDLRRELR